jgi:YesN/AraC family two-component response regulator
MPAEGSCMFLFTQVEGLALKRRAMPVNILIADDHEVVRQGLRTILKVRPDWHICGEAENGREAVQFVSELKPDIVILDVTSPP